MTTDKKDKKPKGLTDKQLVAKYDTGGKVDFERGIKLMSKHPSPTTLSKQKK